MNKRVFLWDTIWTKLYNIHGKSLTYECDIRFLNKWILLYPDCFPKFMVNNEPYYLNFNADLLRYEISKK